MQRSATRVLKLTRALSSSASSSASASTSSSSSASTSSAKTYTPPIKAGVLPAYDEAVKYLAADKDAKLARLEKEKGSLSAAEAEKVEVEAWINQPEVRWAAKNGAADLSLPVFRHLAERAWRKDGSLAILMQRVTQMSVTPDLLAEVVPEVDVQLAVAGETIEPGVYTLPSQTADGFEVRAQVFHPEERLYTLLLVDPDVPDEANASFTTFAHWLVPNVPLSSTQSSIPSSLSATLPYLPPHPQEGTPYHRYTVLLLEQPGQLSLSADSIEREGFNVRAFVREHELEAKGVSFFRQKWTKEERATVSSIYEHVLKRDEPRYGRAKMQDPYQSLGPKYEVL